MSLQSENQELKRTLDLIPDKSRIFFGPSDPSSSHFTRWRGLRRRAGRTIVAGVRGGVKWIARERMGNILKSASEVAMHGE